MEASDELLTIAELAIGLAGFSGVVAAFTHRGGFGPTDRYRFVGLFSQALTVSLLAFVPFGFHHAGQVGEVIWRGSSAVAVLLWVLNAWLIGSRLPEFSPEEALPRLVTGAFLALPIVNLLFQLANVGGWPLAPSALFYLCGLVLWLGIAALFFAVLVLYRKTE